MMSFLPPSLTPLACGLRSEFLRNPLSSGGFHNFSAQADVLVRMARAGQVGARRVASTVRSAASTALGSAREAASVPPSRLAVASRAFSASLGAVRPQLGRSARGLPQRPTGRRCTGRRTAWTWRGSRRQRRPRWQTPGSPNGAVGARVVQRRVTAHWHVPLSISVAKWWLGEAGLTPQAATWRDSGWHHLGHPSQQSTQAPPRGRCVCFVARLAGTLS